jgi:hypothetical protein
VNYPEIRAPRDSTLVIIDVVEISEVKRSNKNTALDFLALPFWTWHREAATK